MPIKNHHVILRSRIEVTVDQHSQNSILQHTIHKIIQQRIMPILSKVFAEYVPDDVVIHLDKLVVDGGRFNLATLRKALPIQVEKVLRIELKKQIEKAIANPTAHQVIPLPDAKRQAIAHYLSEGNFAWWMIERSERQIEQIYLELLHHTPLLIQQFWGDLYKKEKAVQRCMALFARPTVEHTLACLLKQPIESFKLILAETALSLHQTKILTSLLYPLEQQLLAMSLLGTINQQRSKVDRMGFLNMLLKQVALQTSTSYEAILEKLHTYYTQNEVKSSQTIKPLVLQLRDLVVTPPKFWHQGIKKQETVLKELDKVGNQNMACYQLSAAMHSIKLAMDQPNVPALVKSWLQEERNRAKLVKNLPDALFIEFLASIDPSIVALFSDFTQIATATTATIAPASAIKAITLAYCAFEHSKTFYLQEVQALFKKYMANRTISQQRCIALLDTQAYHPAIQSIMAPLLSSTPPLSGKLQNTLYENGIIHQQQATVSKNDRLVQPKVPSSLVKKMPFSVYTPYAAHVLYNKLAAQIKHLDLTESYSERAPLDTCPTKHYTTDSDRDPISVDKVAENPLSDVVDFLLYNELPRDQLVPAYIIAKRLAHATPNEIWNQLAPLCQEAAILKKLMQHATEVTLSKLFQAFIPFPHALLDRLERVIMQSKVVQNSQQQTNIRFIKEIFITAAIMHSPPATEKKYIARILLHLSAQTLCPPTILCDQLIDGAHQADDCQLGEAFSLLKESLAPLNLSKIDEVDLVFLSTHETLPLNQSLWPLYYSRLLPAIKHMVRQDEDLSQPVMDQLVRAHLPTIAQPLQQTISMALYKQITDTLQSKKDRVAQRWHLFLHTGKLGNYPDGTALLNDVMAHLPTFSLAQDKTHVRQRLIANFTHTQLMLLVQRHSDVGKALTSFIEGSHQLWCATQGALEGQHGAKNLFWEGVFKTLPQAPISKEDWLAKITAEWSNLLEITPTTLLATFQLLATTGIPEALTASLHTLQDKYRKTVQQQAIQRGYKTPILTKLYLLFNGNLSLFDQQYHVEMPILGNQLVQCIADRPSALSKFLEEQDNHPLVARRMVHYFSQEVVTKLIAFLAKNKSQFVIHYLDLLTNPLQEATSTPSIWKKELYIATISYLITKKEFKETEFVQNTLLTTCYEKEAICKIIASKVATAPANEAENKLVTLLKPLLKLMHQPTIAPFTLANHPLEKATETKQQAPPPKANTAEKEVRVYTKNTGLVFLWPFFYDFFKMHNLMMGNQFFSEQAAHNAVYLLQYLITGKLKSPEWQLTLPKLLCGLSYDAVLLPYRPINQGYDVDAQEATEVATEASAQQRQKEPIVKTATSTSIADGAMEEIACHSQVLIEKVIKRWKSLTKLKETPLYQDATTEHILKSYFLNRLGILTRHNPDYPTESTFWHLTLMHQEQDQENLLPPWSMTSIKLPWMQEAIILFWMPG